MRLNYPGDLTDTALVGERGKFPYLLRNGSVVDRDLEVTTATYDLARDITVVELVVAVDVEPA